MLTVFVPYLSHLQLYFQHYVRHMYGGTLLTVTRGEGGRGGGGEGM